MRQINGVHGNTLLRPKLVNTDLSSKLIFRDIDFVTQGTESGAEDGIELDHIDGYSPVFISGIHEMSSIKVYFYNFYIYNKQRLQIGWKTVDGSTITNHNVRVVVAYIKN